MESMPLGWLILGFGGQACFFSRFLVQWIVSERRGASVVPLAFWYFSLGGGALLLIYSIYRADPVFMLGQSLGVFIYSRNLVLLRRGSARGDAALSDDRPAQPPEED